MVEWGYRKMTYRKIYLNEVEGVFYMHSRKVTVQRLRIFQNLVLLWWSMSSIKEGMPSTIWSLLLTYGYNSTLEVLRSTKNWNKWAKMPQNHGLKPGIPVNIFPYPIWSKCQASLMKRGFPRIISTSTAATTDHQLDQIQPKRLF